MRTTDGNVYDRVTSCPRGQNPGTSPSTTTSHHARMESRHHAWASTSRVRSWSHRRPPASPARYRTPRWRFRAAKKGVHACRRAPFALPPTQLRASFHCSCCRLSVGVLLEEMPRRLPRRGAAGRIPDGGASKSGPRCSPSFGRRSTIVTGPHHGEPHSPSFGRRSTIVTGPQHG